MATALCLASIASNSPTAAPAGAQNAQWSSFSDGRVSFSYPAAWQKKATGSDKDCICKVGATDSVVELSLNRGNAGGASPATMAQVLQETALAKQPQFREIHTGSLRFGPQGKQEGTFKEVTFKIGDMAIDQKYLLFKIGDEIYTLVKTCRLEDSQSQENFWSQVTGSITVGRQTATRESGRETQAQTPRNIPWKVFASDKNLKFSYPADFKEHESDSAEHPAALSASDGTSKFAALNVFSGDIHPAETQNHAAAVIEEKYWSTQKNYRSLHEEIRTSGKNGNLEMTVKESTYDNKEGRPIRRLAAFFRSGEKLWVLSLETWGWTANETNGLFSKVISSLEILN